MSMLFKRIKDWATRITAFRTVDVIPVEGPRGTAKMSKDDLLARTTENTLGSIHSLSRAETDGYLAVDNATNGTGKMNTSVIFNNFAGKFSDTQDYVINNIVVYKGSTYRFKANHPAGAWSSSDVTLISLEKAFLEKFTAIENNYAFEAFTGLGQQQVKEIPVIPGSLVKISVASDWSAGDIATGQKFIIALVGSTERNFVSIGKTSSVELNYTLATLEDTKCLRVYVRGNVGERVSFSYKVSSVPLNHFSATPLKSGLLENGDISMNSIGNSYYNSTTRVRTSHTIQMKKGDVITFNKQTYLYINQKFVGDDSWTPKGWIVSTSYYIEEDCEVALLLRLSPEVAISVSDITERVSIYTNGSEGVGQRLDGVETLEEELIADKKVVTEQVGGNNNGIKYSSWIPVNGNSYITLVIGSHDVSGVTSGYLVEGIEMRRASDNVSWLVCHEIKNAGESNRPAKTFYSFYVPKGFNAVRAATRSTQGTNAEVTLYREVVPPNFKFGVSGNIKNVSHRGVFLGSDIPQNSEISYSLSIAFGYKYVETDIRETSDGKFVCSHNDTYRSMSIATSTLAELSAVPIRSEEIYSGHTILTFERLLQIAKKSGLHVYCDIKSVTHISDFCALVNSYSMGKHISVVAGYASILAEYKQYLPNARLGLLVGSLTQQQCTDLLALKTSENEVFVDGNNSTMTSADYELAAQNGIQLEEWTSNDIVDNRSVGLTTNSQFPPSILAQSGQTENLLS